jgi:hypothetical protein
MQSIFTLSRLAVATAACAFSLSAQCFESNTGASVGIGDDIVLPAQTLGFAFPFNGSTYTTVHPCSNGFVYLGNGTASTDPLCCTGDIANMTAASSPMIAPYWSDLNILAANSGDVKFNALATKAVITWENASQFYNSGVFTFQLQLFPSGEFDFVYLPSVAVYASNDLLAGMSPGSGAIAGAATDFGTVGTGATNTNYQMFGPAVGPMALAGRGIHFVPTVPGYVWVPTSCSANHASYGTGCYNLAASFYSLLTSAPAASALNGTGIMMIKTPAGYIVIPGGSYVAPTGAATALALTDDSETTVALSSPLPYPGGTTSSLTVCSNGFVSVATGNGTYYVPSATDMLNNPQTAWYAWKDYNPGVLGSGQIKFEQVGSFAYVTWDGVANFGGTSADVSTMQFQFDTSTGNVTIFWQAMSVASPSTTSDYGIGFSPGGASLDPGSISIPGGLPVSTTADFPPLVLTASPAPISTPILGTLVTYTTSNIPEYAPSTGLYIALNILSVGQIPAPGIDLVIIGAPGCPGLVASLDVTQAMVGFTNSQSVTFNIPPGVPAGLTVYSQSAAMVQPFSLPNGQNAFGLTTSNGIATFINNQ